MNPSKRIKKAEKENKKQCNMKRKRATRTKNSGQQNTAKHLEEGTNRRRNAEVKVVMENKEEGEDPSTSTTTNPEDQDDDTANVTWDLDPGLQVAVYSTMDINELEWDEDEDTPPGAILSAQCHSQTQYSTSTTARNLPGISGAIYSPGGYSYYNLENNDEKSIEDTDCCSKNWFTGFSDEIILRIFSYLTRKTVVKCIQVCKDWNRLGSDESLWYRANLEKVRLIRDGVLGSLMHRGVRVLKINRAEIVGSLCSSSCHKHNSKEVEHNSKPVESRKRSSSQCQSRKSPKQLFKSCTNFPIQYIDATLSNFQDGTLFQMLQKCKSLKKLSLEGCTLSLPILRAISENSQLEVLNLCMCKGITTNGIASLANKCKRLISFNVSWTNLSREALLKISTAFPKIQEINLSGFREAMNDTVVEKLMRSCPELTNLDISDSPNIGKTALEAISRNVRLRKLGLSRCYGIPANRLSIFAEMESLQHLQMFGFLNKEALLQLERACPNLRINSETLSDIARPVTNYFSGKIWSVKCGVR